MSALTPLGMATGTLPMRRLEQFERAAQVWEGVLGEFEAMGDPRGVAVSLAGWGGCLAAAGKELAMAAELLERAEANYRTLGLVDEAGRLAAERAAVMGRVGR